MDYNEAIIQSVRYKGKQADEAIEQWIIDNPFITIDYTNLDNENITNIELIENYILKNIRSLKPEVKNFVVNYLNNVYKGFLDNPEKYITSPLLKDELVNKISAPEYLEKYKNKKQEVLNSSWKIYQKSLTESINDKEKDLLSNFFIKMIDTDNENLKNAMSQYAKKIIRESCIETEKDGEINFEYLPISEMNTSELRFIAFYASRFVNRDNLVRNVHIVNFNSTETEGIKEPGGNYSNEIIRITKKSSIISDLDRFLQVMCHETEHAIQEYASKNEDSVIALDTATDKILRDYLTTEKYNPYMNNYQYSEIETDANEMGWHYSSALLSTLGLQNRAKRQIDRESEEVKSNNFEFSFKQNPQNQFVTLEEMQIDELRKIIKENPELKQEYPVLQNFYNNDGTEKPFEELIVDASKSSRGGETYELYKNYLIYQARQDSFSNLDLSRFNDEEKARIYITATKLLSDSRIKIEKHARRSQEVLKGRNKLDHDDANDILIKTGKENITTFINLLSIFSNNYEEIRRLEEMGLIPINYNGTNSIKGNLESLNNINLKKYDNLPYYRELGLAQALSGEIVQKIYIRENKKKVNEELAKYDDTTLSSQVTLPNGMGVTLRDYIENNLFKQMDKHGFVVTPDGQQIDLSAAIQSAMMNNLQKTKDTEQDEITEIREWVQTNQLQNEYIEQVPNSVDLSQTISTSMKR